MADEWKVPKGHPSIPHRIRRYGLALASVVLALLASLGTLISFLRSPEWKLQLGIALAAVFAVAILWKVPQWQVDKVSDLEPKDRFDCINEARKTLAQIIGGIAVLAGFYATVQNINLSQKSFALAQQGQITDRFTKAIEQLGAVDSAGKRKLEVRLGGIYALARIAHESASDQLPIEQVLSAYVRDNAPTRPQRELNESTRAGVPPNVKPAPDIQAILTALGTSYVIHVVMGTPATGSVVEPRAQVLNLSEADMRGVNLARANFSRTNFTRADFTQAQLNETNFSKAYFSGAVLSQADLSGADLSGADLLNANLIKAVLIGANLRDADLRDADLSGADISGADFKGAYLNRADISGADLTSAKNLTQQQIDSTKGDSDTALPSNLHMPEAWKSGH